VAPPADALNEAERQALGERLRGVRAALEAACTDASLAKPPLLLAVSKGHPARAIRAAYEQGQRHFGENYVQELVEKAEALADLDGLVWHLIGHLQRNKAKHVVEHAQAVHSVDSPLLLAELDRRMTGREIPPARRAFGSDPRLPIFLEVSIAGEEQKGGCDPAELGALIDAADSASALRLVGLMCVPPLDGEATRSREYFDKLRALRDEHGGVPRLPELSMGMTHDYEHAIRAGSTVVRIGTAIFGPRPPRERPA